MKHGCTAVPEASAPIDSDTAIFVRGACIAIALFARYHMSPRMALKEMGIPKALAEQSGVTAFDLMQLKPHWPKPRKVVGIKTKKKARR